MIGIIVATEMEAEELKKFIEIDHVETIANMKLYYGTMACKDVVMCRSQAGKGMASMATTILCLYARVQGIINIGTAGGLRMDENVLDIVISDKVVQADYDTSPLDGPEGLGLYFESDQQARNACIQAAKECGLPYHVGTIASQDLFMSREEDIQRVLRLFPDSICSEMEAGAIGQVCTAFQVPYVIVRSLSDIVHKQDNHMDYNEYAPIASRNAARLVQKWLENL